MSVDVGGEACPNGHPCPVCERAWRRACRDACRAAARAARRGPRPEALHRMARIVELTGAGWTARRIGRELGVSYRVVERGRALARRVGAVPAAGWVAHRPREETVERAARVARLTAAGLTAHRIARELGVSVRTVTRDRALARAGWVPAVPVGVRGRPGPPPCGVTELGEPEGDEGEESR